MPHSSSEGPQTPPPSFFPPPPPSFLPSFWWNLLFHQSMQESPVSLLHFTDEVRGRSTPRILQKREALELLYPVDCSLLSHSSSPPTLAVHEHRHLGGQRLICEDTRPVWEISLTRAPPSSGQWLMKPASWQVRMSSLGLVWGPRPVLMTPTLALWIVPMHAFITDILGCSFSAHIHVLLCLKGSCSLRELAASGLWTLLTLRDSMLRWHPHKAR